MGTFPFLHQPQSVALVILSKSVTSELVSIVFRVRRLSIIVSRCVVSMRLMRDNTQKKPNFILIFLIFSVHELDPVLVCGLRTPSKFVLTRLRIFMGVCVFRPAPTCGSEDADPRTAKAYRELKDSFVASRREGDMLLLLGSADSIEIHKSAKDNAELATKRAANVKTQLLVDRAAKEGEIKIDSLPQYRRCGGMEELRAVFRSSCMRSGKKIGG